MAADLVFRLSGTTLTLPPLRDRTGDVRPLAEAFVREFGGANPPRLTEGAREALDRYGWPGNVHELRAVLERAVLLAGGRPIQAAELALEGSGEYPVIRMEELLTLEELERRHIGEVLEKVDWHQGRAADILGISPKTLYRKIREFGFQRPRGALVT